MMQLLLIVLALLWGRVVLEHPKAQRERRRRQQTMQQAKMRRICRYL